MKGQEIFPCISERRTASERAAVSWGGRLIAGCGLMDRTTEPDSEALGEVASMMDGLPSEQPFTAARALIETADPAVLTCARNRAGDDLCPDFCRLRTDPPSE